MEQRSTGGQRVTSDKQERKLTSGVGKFPGLLQIVAQQRLSMQPKV